MLRVIQKEMGQLTNMTDAFFFFCEVFTHVTEEHEMTDPRYSCAGFLLISPTCATDVFQFKKLEKHCPKISRQAYVSFVLVSDIFFK